ncbi:hypothetical protein Nepgr_029858 [Nepenthes gracilis]|uniref:Uncharacterized protein n=1 Tax=Nepenthes gracilis TaxID=150966 RepID=A0AAD3TED4_NEPGR|nr:hypothetical protein Nepgr_029858 [Nepenthes gracilis]
MAKSEEIVGLEYWLKWQVPVCALIIVIPFVISLISIKRRKSTADPLNNNDLWLPCWRKLNPIWLLIYRALAFLCMAWLLYEMIAFAGFLAFYFYTQWTFALVMVYFAVGTIISAQGYLRYLQLTIEVGEKDKFLNSESEERKTTATVSFMARDKGINGLQKHDNWDESSERTGLLGRFMHIIYQISAGAVMLTDLVFWCILVPLLAGKEFEVTLLIGSIHSMNAVFLLIDSVLNSVPFEWFGFTYFVLWSALYVIFQWVLHACCLTWWPYPFLELSTSLAPLWYLGLALIHIPCYGLYILIMKAKAYIFSRQPPYALLRSHKQILHRKKAA